MEVNLKNNEKGITLIEVIVASIIMAISIGTLLYLYVPSFAVVQASKQSTISQALFESEFEKIKKLTTQDDLKKYLYHNENVTKPINQEHPLRTTIDGIEYSLYYADQAGDNKPYMLFSLGDDNDSFLKPDGNYGAKVIQVSVFITWEGKNGKEEKRNVIFRGQDAADI